jgi:hypothetical protein
MTDTVRDIACLQLQIIRWWADLSRSLFGPGSANQGCLTRGDADQENPTLGTLIGGTGLSAWLLVCFT